MMNKKENVLKPFCHLSGFSIFILRASIFAKKADLV